MSKTNSSVVVCSRACSELELIAVGPLHSHAGNPFVTRCVLTSLIVGATCCGQKLLDTFLCWKSTVATDAMLQGALQLLITLGSPFSSEDAFPTNHVGAYPDATASLGHLPNRYL